MSTPPTPDFGLPQPPTQLSQAAPQAPMAGQPVPPAPVKKGGGLLRNRAVIAIGALVIGLILGSAAAGGSNAPATSPAAALPASTVTATVTASPEGTAEPDATATEEPSAEPTEEATTKAPAPEKKSYKTLTSRQFKRLAKDPDSYIGKTYVIYGEVTQFDSATGTEGFRADTGPKKLRISYGFVDYKQNTILSGTEKMLKNIVEGDCFKAKVTVSGSYSYDTQMGGNTTVPQFDIDSISVYGSTD